MEYYLGYVLSVLLTILSAIKNYVRLVILAWKLPGPPAVPLLGNILLVNDKEELSQVANYAYKLYGAFFRIWITFLPTICIYEPAHLKVILSTNKTNEKGMFYKALHTFVGEGLITNNGYKWKNNRKMIQPYFHVNVLETFLDIFSECSGRFVKTLEGEKTVNITSFINNYVLDVLHNGVLGVPIDKDSPYRKGEMQAVERCIKPWLLLEPIFNWTSSANSEKEQKHNLHSYTKQVLLNRKKEPKSTKPCFLDMFIEITENNSQFTEDNLINETVTFMLAGQDSVGATLAFTMFYIAKYPEVQEKIFKEISKFDVNEKLTMKEISGMKYLEQVIKEALRLVPAIPMIMRVLTEDVTLDDMVLPAGTNLLISPFITHRLPHVFPEPEKFDPDRFEESNIEKMHPYAFLPFSLGPRNCIGYKFAILELKAALFYLLSKYEITLPQGKEEYDLTYRVTLRASGGIWISLRSRNS